MSTDTWQLVDKNGAVVNVGAKLETFRGEPCTLEGGTPPHHSGSTGRVEVKFVKPYEHTRSFFPSVVNLVWRKE